MKHRRSSWWSPVGMCFSRWRKKKFMGRLENWEQAFFCLTRNTGFVWVLISSIPIFVIIGYIQKLNSTNLSLRTPHTVYSLYVFPHSGIVLLNFISSNSPIPVVVHCLRGRYLSRWSEPQRRSDSKQLFHRKTFESHLSRSWNRSLTAECSCCLKVKKAFPCLLCCLFRAGGTALKVGRRRLKAEIGEIS